MTQRFDRFEAGARVRQRRWFGFVGLRRNAWHELGVPSGKLAASSYRPTNISIRQHVAAEAMRCQRHGGKVAYILARVECIGLNSSGGNTESHVDAFVYHKRVLRSPKTTGLSCEVRALRLFGRKG
jgi:hypothetical protein